MRRKMSHETNEAAKQPVTDCNRLDNVAKREREAGAEAAQICGEVGETIGREATREKSSRVGNSAKLREACEALMSEIGGYLTDGLEVIWCSIRRRTTSGC